MQSQGELTAEEALKQYYDKMYELELNLKNEIEHRLGRKGGLNKTNEVSVDEDDLPEHIVVDLGPTKYTLEGQKLLEEIHNRRISLHDQDKPASGGLASVYYDSEFQVKAQDLIMMNVEEKLEFLQKRRKFLQSKKAETGLTNEVEDVLRKRKMTIHDL